MGMPGCFRTIKENEHRKEIEANDDRSEHECMPKRQHNGENTNKHVLTGASGRCSMGMPVTAASACTDQRVKIVKVKLSSWLMSNG